MLDCHLSLLLQIFQIQRELVNIIRVDHMIRWYLSLIIDLDRFGQDLILVSFGRHNWRVETIYLLVEEKYVLVWDVLSNFKIKCGLLKCVQLLLQLVQTISVLLGLLLNRFDQPILLTLSIVLGQMKELICVPLRQLYALLTFGGVILQERLQPSL